MTQACGVRLGFSDARLFKSICTLRTVLSHNSVIRFLKFTLFQGIRNLLNFTSHFRRSTYNLICYF